MTSRTTPAPRVRPRAAPRRDRRAVTQQRRAAAHRAPRRTVPAATATAAGWAAGARARAGRERRSTGYGRLRPGVVVGVRPADRARAGAQVAQRAARGRKLGLRRGGERAARAAGWGSGAPGNAFEPPNCGNPAQPTGRAHRPRTGATRRAGGRTDTVGIDELGMRAALDDGARVDHEDLVGALGGGEPVRDRQRRPAVGERVQGAGQPLLGRRVDGAGRLVEHQQVGVGDVGAGERDQLPLPRRQRLAALADRRARRRPAARRASRRARARRTRPRSRASVMPGPAVPDVVGDGGVEQEAVLRHHHHPRAQRGEGDLVQRHPAGGVRAEQHPPVDRVHQPGEQLGERRLARAGLADDRDPAARRDG